MPDGARAGARLGVGDVEVEAAGLDVDRHRHAARPHHRLGGGEEGERRHQHLVAGTQAERVQRQHQRVGAVGDADAAGAAEVVRRSAFSKASTSAPPTKAVRASRSLQRASSSGASSSAAGLRSK